MHIDSWQIIQAKDGNITAKENGSFLHSSYAPEKEASQLVKKSDFPFCKGAVFYSTGLGYSVINYAKTFPERTIIIVEPDEKYFFASLSFLDWSPVFSLSSIIIALVPPVETSVSLIESVGFSSCAFFSNAVHTQHAKKYFFTLQTLATRNIQKDKINVATTKKFLKLWTKNACKNIFAYTKFDGVNIYENNIKGVPFTILAAGPSLEDILPHLTEIKKRSVLVCVDTALRSCLNSGVEPDFIIIGDPQYYAYRHIADSSAKNSTLIADIAVYPSVFRFACKKIVLSSSPFPICKWFEKKFGKRGELGMGGSVSSNAWNFAHFAGANEIYIAGLDLSYPKNNTHAKGSTFETNALVSAKRTSPAESKNILHYLFAGLEEGSDYNGNKVITDSKMKMFAWWFESRIASLPQTKTYTFCSKGLSIPGVNVTTVKSFLQKPIIENKKIDLFKNAEKKSNAIEKKLFATIYEQFKSEFNTLYENAKNGLELCKNILENKTEDASLTKNTMQKITLLEQTIFESEQKEFAHLVYTVSKSIFESEQNVKSENKILQSKCFFEELLKYASLMTHCIKGLTRVF
ncbi:MAG: motility associated factor glycosyltransferase family protein [Treponema sp.]|nr:motility associated factor glycosyltransferase family protein [Treponema sp.]